MDYKHLCQTVSEMSLSDEDKITAAFFLGQAFLLRELQARSTIHHEVSLRHAHLVVPPELIQKCEAESSSSASSLVLELLTGAVKKKQARESWID